MKQRAQEIVEYALLLATMAVLILLGGWRFGDAIHGWFNALLARILAT